MLTSAAASDVTSIRFTARKANTAAARTGKECTVCQLLAYSWALHTVTTRASERVLCTTPPPHSELRAGISGSWYSREQCLVDKQTESKGFEKKKIQWFNQNYL